MDKKVLLYIESQNAVYYDHRDGNYYYKVLDTSKAKYGGIGGIFFMVRLREINFFSWEWNRQLASFIFCQLVLLAGYCIDLRKNKTAFHRMYIGKNEILQNMDRIKKGNRRNIKVSIFLFAIMVGVLFVWTRSHDMVWMLFGVAAEFFFLALILLDKIFLVNKTIEDIFTDTD